MNRKNFKQYINQLSKFPDWMKTVIAEELLNNTGKSDNDISYVFATYKPILTFKGQCELQSKNTGFDRNIYNILELISKDYSISEISLDTYLTLGEVSSYFIMSVNDGFVEVPEDKKILSVANFLSGKSRIGEYLSDCNKINDEQLSQAVNLDKTNKMDRKFGKILMDLGFVQEGDIHNIIKLKNDAGKRFILDYNEVPNGTLVYSNISDKYKKEIEDLQLENKKLKSKLNQLLTMVKMND